MTTTFAPGVPSVPLDGRPDAVGELARRELGRVDRLDADAARLDVAPRCPSRGPSVRSRMVSSRSSKAKIAARSPRAAAALAYWMASVDLPLPAGPRRTALVPYWRPPPSRASSSALPDLSRPALLAAVVLGGDEPREDVEPARLDDEVVVAAPVLLAPELRDPQPPPLGAVLGRELLQAHDAVGDALELQVLRLGRQVVEQEHRAFPADEELLQGEDLPAVAERVLGQQPHLRERVDDDPPRLDPLDLGEDGLGRLAQLDLGGLEHGSTGCPARAPPPARPAPGW